jgi:hypothetical protein
LNQNKGAFEPGMQYLYYTALWIEKAFMQGIILES